MPDLIYSHNYTYEIENKINRIRYIGVRSCNEAPVDDPYMGSSKRLNEAIAIEGKENFTKKILQTFPTREEAMKHEIDLHELYDVARNPMFYNQAKSTSTGFDICGTQLSEETKRKMSESHKGKGCQPRTAMKGRKHTEASKRKISEAHKGKKMSDAAKRKISEYAKNRTEEHRRKLKENSNGASIGFLGKKHTEEFKKKMSEASKRLWQDKEHRRKMSE